MGLNLSQNSVTALKERYLLRDDEGTVIEVPAELFKRVAKHIASVEPGNSQDKKYWEEQFHSIITPKEGQFGADFLPNTPTLMNAGLPNGQLSACFVLPVEDSIDGIFDTLRRAAKIHQSGGGTGFSFSRLRQEGAMVDSKQGVASGPNSFASVYNQATEIMKQGGKRKGANMYVMDVHHPDCDPKFIDMKLTPGVMTNFNVSVGISNDFMAAYKMDKHYAVKEPHTGKTLGVRSAVDTLEKIAKNAAKSAEPGIIFTDRVNEKSPYQEKIEATNPCGEQPLPPNGSCNLGSINLSNFVLEGDVDWERLERVVRISTRFLDNVIDANHYPDEELTAHAKKYRNIGLGVMGFADMLLWLRIPYGSEESIALATNLGEFINEAAHHESVKLGKEKGLPEAAPFKTFFAYSSPLRRNATLTTIAPTGSLCIIACCSSGCEPNFAYELVKLVLDQRLVEYHPIMKLAKEQDWYSEEVFVDAHSVTPEQHVDIQAAFQTHCDSAISKTINLPRGSTWQDVLRAYVRAWNKGCKGCTVYVDGSREGVLHKLEVEEDDDLGFDRCDCGGEIVVESGCESCKSCGTSKCLIA